MANWISLNGFDGNEEQVEKILRKFGIDKYHYNTIDGLSALTIEIDLNVYRLEIDDYKEELIVRKRKYTKRGQRRPKEHMKIITSFKNDCLYEGIKFVKRDSKNYLT